MSFSEAELRQYEPPNANYVQYIPEPYRQISAEMAQRLQQYAAFNNILHGAGQAQRHTVRGPTANRMSGAQPAEPTWKKSSMFI